MVKIQDVAPYTYLVISGLVYLIVIIYLFYSKRKIKTIENFCYGVILWLTFSTALLDIVRILIPAFIDSSTLVLILNKLMIMMRIFWLSAFNMYVYSIATKKYQGYTSFNDNKYKNYFKKISYVILGIGFIVAMIAVFLPLDMTNYIFLAGKSYNVTIVWFAISLLFWIVLMLLNLSKTTIKRYIPVLGLIIIIAFSISLKYLFPELSNIIAAAILSVIFMFFTMENPDIVLINELNEAKEKASKANADKTKFLSTMSHEIRTPLNAIVGLSQSLSEDATITDNAKEELNDIIMSSESLLEIVNGILDISKIEEDIIEITPFEYSITKLIQEVISLSKSRLDASGKPIEFFSNIDSNIPPVLFGDAGKIKEIVVNFLTNAIKYTEKGSITFTVKNQIKDEMCKLDISVSDTGMGIKEEDLGKLFTKFQRFDLDKNNSVEGTGLGLSITKKMVELMGGEVKVSSVYGKGSTFSVIIDQKIVNKKSLEDEENNSSQPFDASNQVVAVVDDNQINLKVAKKVLLKYKLKVVAFDSLEGFKNSIKNGDTYNLVLLDEGTPEESTLIKELKSTPGFITPVIAYTANAISGIKERYLEVGYDDYLSKPVDKKELRKVLRKYLKENINGSGQQEVVINPVVQKENNMIENEIPVAPATVEAQPVMQEQIVVAPQPGVVSQEPVVEIAPAVNPQPVEVAPVVEAAPTVEVPVEVAPVVEVAPTIEQPVEVAPVVETAPTVEQPVLEVKPVVETREDDEMSNVPPIPINVGSVGSVIGVTSQELQTQLDNLETAAATAIPGIIGTPSHTREFLEANKCNVDKALESLGDMETYDIGAEEFVAEYENNMQKIKTAKENNDMENYAIETHGLKSNARYLGFEELGDMAYKHELAGKGNDTGFVSANYESLVKEADKVNNILKNYMES